MKHHTDESPSSRRPTTDDTPVRIAYLECFSGISGDMFLGALVDAGVPLELFQETVSALDLGARLEVTRVDRSGISATKVEVMVDGRKEQPRGLADHPSPSPQTHSRQHSHEPHAHAHEPQYAPFEDFHTHPAGHGRALKEIEHLIGHAKISLPAKSVAFSMFEKLGKAEAKIHNVPIENIHFHEVGAVDAIVDIVCSAVGADALKVDQFLCSPLNVGGGTIECAHGVFPVPAPATVELLQSVPVYSSGVKAELVTPTGAAIVTTLTSRFESFPAMKIEKTGYGAGTHNFPGQPNVSRLVLGRSLPARHTDEGTRPAQILEAEADTIAVLEVNLDDLSPQVFGYVTEELFRAGALDVFGSPVQMKKNRPGTLLTVLARPDDAESLTKIIFAETTTLGVRLRQERRQTLPREWQTVSTRFGDIRIKVARVNGTISSYAPEYEDCRRIASEQRVPLKQVMQEAVQAYLQVTKTH